MCAKINAGDSARISKVIRQGKSMATTLTVPLVRLQALNSASWCSALS